MQPQVTFSESGARLEIKRNIQDTCKGLTVVTKRSVNLMESGFKEWNHRFSWPASSVKVAGPSLKLKTLNLNFGRGIQK